jgi:serine/threonine protein phosphatase 1
MRTLAIGDIHGCLTALRALLDAVAPGPDDRLVSLGDFVDRGPDSRGVLELLISLKQGGRLVTIQGNHEQMMREARHSPEGCRMWLACGGRPTLTSYGARHPADLSVIPEEHWAFLEDHLVDWFETDTHFFVHGSAFYDIPLDEQPWDMNRWEPFYQPLLHVSGKIMVCGHTKQHEGVPANIGHAVCIDTGAYESHGWLTCLDVASGKLWQANQRGAVRTGHLEEPRASEDVL